MIGYLNGFKVYESRQLTKSKMVINRNPRLVRRKRTIKPVKNRPTRIITVPSTEAIMDTENKAMYMHPVMVERLKGEIKKQVVYSPFVRPSDSFLESFY